MLPCGAQRDVELRAHGVEELPSLHRSMRPTSHLAREARNAGSQGEPGRSSSRLDSDLDQVNPDDANGVVHRVSHQENGMAIKLHSRRQRRWNPRRSRAAAAPLALQRVGRERQEPDQGVLAGHPRHHLEDAVGIW
jgi:hypothetical protein